MGQLTLPLEILLDGILLDLHILHNVGKAGYGVVQSRDDTCRRKLAQSKKQHETDRLDLVMVLQGEEDPLEEQREVDFAETGAELCCMSIETGRLRQVHERGCTCSVSFGRSELSSCTHIVSNAVFRFSSPASSMTKNQHRPLSKTHPSKGPSRPPSAAPFEAPSLDTAKAVEC